MIQFFNEVAEEHFVKVVEFAGRRLGLIPKLLERLDALGNLAENSFGSEGDVILSKDFAPYSFCFQILHRLDNSRHGMNGGLIYSGPTGDGKEVRLDGGAPAYTVSLSDSGIGWTIHT